MRDQQVDKTSQALTDIDHFMFSVECDSLEMLHSCSRSHLFYLCLFSFLPSHRLCHRCLITSSGKTLCNFSSLSGSNNLMQDSLNSQQSKRLKLFIICSSYPTCSKYAILTPSDVNCWGYLMPSPQRFFFKIFCCDCCCFCEYIINTNVEPTEHIVHKLGSSLAISLIFRTFAPKH